MTTTPSLPQGFPQNASRFVDDKGQITQPWLWFLRSIWIRTGAATGSTTFSSGDLKSSASSNPQDGWLVCDGSPVSRSLFPDLFAAIGITWGAGDGVTTFNLPDFRRRGLVGAGSGYAVGGIAGAESVAIGIANLPAHDHPVIDPEHHHLTTEAAHTHVDSGHVHVQDPNTMYGVGPTGLGPGGVVGFQDGGGTTDSAAANIQPASTGLTINNASTGITVGNTGGGAALDVRNPFGVVTWLIKV